MAGMISSEPGADGDEAMATINVTSLIDVMFCLLIGFMVATPLMNQEKLPIEIPKARGDVITEEEFLYSVISIDATGQVFIGVLPLSKDKTTMMDEVANNTKLKEDGRAFIQGDANAPYENVLDVLVALKKAGVSDVGFVTDPRMDEGA